MRNKISAVFLCICILLTAIPVQAMASEPSSKATNVSGTDNGIQWSIVDGKLTLRGSGNPTLTRKNGITVVKAYADYLDQIYEVDIDLQNCTKGSCLFAGLTSVNKITFGDNFKKNKFTATVYMFEDCIRLKSLDLNWMDMSANTDMQGMFEDCVGLRSVFCDKWNTSNVTDMDYLFNGCYYLMAANVSNWDVRKVTEISDCFYGCENLTTIDIHKWQCDSLKDMSGMFRNCKSLESININGITTPKVKTIANMFRDCKKLKSVNMASADLSNLYNLIYVFNGCESLHDINFPAEKATNITSVEGLFLNCYDLNGNIKFASGKIKKYDDCFKGAATNSKNRVIIDFTGDCKYASAKKMAETGDANHVFVKGSIRPIATAITESRNVNGGIEIKWNKAQDADAYVLYRSVNGAEYSHLATVASTSYIDKNAIASGNTYGYKVTAISYDRNNNNSVLSAPQTAEKKQYYLSQMKFSAKNKKTNTIELKFKKNKKATGYEIWYAKNSKFKKKVKLTISKNNVSKLRIKKLKKNKIYYIKVRSYKKTDTGTYYGVWSKVSKIKIKK